MLPDAVMTYLSAAAAAARASLPSADESLFRTGVLDSFSLVEFVAVVEQECGITVPDADLRVENFDTIAKVEAFVARARADA